ncbi:MAG: leucyl/phenylalanyl-tRNA--protein transferase [Actinomycetales bacterium]
MMARHRREPWSEPIAAEFERLLAGAQPGEDLVCLGADLNPTTVLTAYTRGLFPMGLGRNGSGPLGWWSPDPRGVIPLTGLRVSRSLRRATQRFEIRVDTAFDAVVAACADPGRAGRWITPAIAETYARLHRDGVAHSVEAWQDGALVGGLYGIGIGGLFAGESMFHRATDASKVALVGLVELLSAEGLPRLLDVQWRTDHLASLGAQAIPRTRYLLELAQALELPAPRWRPGPLCVSG